MNSIIESLLKGKSVRQVLEGYDDEVQNKLEALYSTVEKWIDKNPGFDFLTNRWECYDVHSLEFKTADESIDFSIDFSEDDDTVSFWYLYKTKPGATVTEIETGVPIEMVNVRFLDRLFKDFLRKHGVNESCVADPKFVAWVDKQAANDFEYALEYHSGPNFIDVTGSNDGTIKTLRYNISDFNKNNLKESSEEDTYSCDACGAEKKWDDIYWFTSSIGFCPVCAEKLHIYIPQKVLDFCSEECEAGDNDVAHFIISMADGTYIN